MIRYLDHWAAAALMSAEVTTVCALKSSTVATGVSHASGFKWPQEKEIVGIEFWGTWRGITPCRNSESSGNLHTTLSRSSKYPLSFGHSPGLAHRPPEGYYYR
ncbi:hypothetical protein TNCV_1425871 [Trichonephila clavipes]|nr:hypothetical protein TNCV_1425871 [Trichonephila clavipes]